MVVSTIHIDGGIKRERRKDQCEGESRGIQLRGDAGSEPIEASPDDIDARGIFAARVVDHGDDAGLRRSGGHNHTGKTIQ